MTDGTALQRGDWLVERVKKLQVELVIVREKMLSAGPLTTLTQRLVRPGLRVLVAGRVDVALAAGAQGVHLSARPGELTPAQVRAIMPGAVITVSCHSVEEVRRARANGADTALFGPVFGKWVEGVEVVAGVGLERLAQACEIGVPVLALGGLTQANAPACVLAGAAGIAAIRLYFSDALP